MSEQAKRFVAEWRDRNIKDIPRQGYPFDLILCLVSRLEHAAWAYGIIHDDFLAVVGTDTYAYILYAIEFPDE